MQSRAASLWIRHLWSVIKFGIILLDCPWLKGVTARCIITLKVRSWCYWQTAIFTLTLIKVSRYSVIWESYGYESARKQIRKEVNKKVPLSTLRICEYCCCNRLFILWPYYYIIRFYVVYEWMGEPYNSKFTVYWTYRKPIYKAILFPLIYLFLYLFILL